jgi:hypothetical protein
MTLIATRISDRFIDVDTDAGPLRLTREALTGSGQDAWPWTSPARRPSASQADTRSGCAAGFGSTSPTSTQLLSSMRAVAS